MSDLLKNDPTLVKLAELFANGKVKHIHNDGVRTMIEFESGEFVPLMGGQMDLIPIEELKKPMCNFCEVTGVPLISPPNKNEPLICSKCTTSAVQLFTKHGIEMEFNIMLKGE